MSFFLQEFNKKLDTVSFFVEFEKKISKDEQKFMVLLIDEFEKNRIGNKLTIEIKKSISYFKLKDRKELLEMLDSFINKTIRYSFEDKETKELIVSGTFTMLSSVKYNENIIELIFPDEFVDSYKGDNIFNKIHLTTIIKFRLNTTISLYLELVKSTGTQGSLEFSLGNLKKMFAINDSYDRFYDFEKNIIKILIEEINFYSEYHVEYEKVKSGEGRTNKVVALKFDFYNKILDEIQKKSNELMLVIKEKVYDFNLVMTMLGQYLRSHNYKYVKDNINFALEHYEENFDAFFIASLQNNYAQKYFELWTEEADGKYELLINNEQNFSSVFKLESELYKHLSQLKFYYDSDFISELHKLKIENKLEFENNEIKIFVEFNKKGNSHIKIYRKN